MIYSCFAYCRDTAKDRYNLKKMGITHILNAAEGTWNSVDTGPGYYGDMDIVYYGVVAEDMPAFDLSQYFFSAAQFIHKTLINPQSKNISLIFSEKELLWLLLLMPAQKKTEVYPDVGLYLSMFISR